MKISIIIPCYNERNTIETLLKRVNNIKIEPNSTEIIVVDDGSTDGTTEILKKYEGNYRIIYNPKNLGKGTAVQKGIASSTGEYILIQDADLEYDPKEIPSLVDAIRSDGASIVYGSRNLSSRGKYGMYIPRFGVWLITKEFNFLYGTHLTDLWTCYKLFPREAGRFFTDGGFESELKFSVKIIKAGYKIIEVPISHKPRSKAEGKKITYMDGLVAILAVLKYRFID